MDAGLDGLREAPVLVTGGAGFVGFHLARRLLQLGCKVVVFENLDAYYDPALKEARLAQLARVPGFSFVRGDLADAEATRRILRETKPLYVAHMAAQAGLRHSLHCPQD